jgi:hypothetical protein
LHSLFLFFELFQEIDATESCETLLQSGHTAPGYYFVDGPGGVNYELVRCNLDLDPSDAQFQVAASTNMLAEYPVAFHCRINDFSTVNAIFPCNTLVVNVGNAMDATGVFTVPIDGVYMFTFSGTSGSNDVSTIIRIRADGTALGYFRLLDGRSGHGDEVLTGSVQVIANLTMGQKVDAYLDSGYTDNALNFFTGHLLYPV